MSGQDSHTNLRKDKTLLAEVTQADSLESVKSAEQNIKDKLKCFKDADAEPANDLSVDPDKARHQMLFLQVSDWGVLQVLHMTDLSCSYIIHLVFN